MKLKPYPKYKPSGVEWLGDVPADWDVNRVKWSVLACINGTWGDEPTGDGDIICVRVADFDRDNFRVVDEPPTLRSVDTNQLKTRKLKKGDLLIEKSGGGEKQLVGCVVFFDHSYRAVCSNFVARMPVARGMNARFWSYVHAALYRGKLNYPAIKQTTGIQNLDASCYLDTPAAFPSLGEQKTIASVLDRETGRIDRLVVKKRELIERLKEKRTALISRTVTRGLPPAAARAAGLPANPPLKPSGIDWLGEIPAHWEVRKFSREVAIAEGQVDPEKEPYASMLLIGPEHVESGTGRLLQQATAADQAAESGKYLSRKNDVIYSKIRPALRKVVIAPDDCLCSADMYPLRGRSRIGNKFLFWFFLSEEFSGWSVLESDRVAMPKINRDTLNELRMPVPPPFEQTAIATYLYTETAKLDALLSKVEEAIERLQEYRTALITAAVTGKIDVREEVAL